MRTVLSEIRLFNDNISKRGYHIYMNWKEGEKEQDSGETERERVCERQSVAERGGSMGCKTSHWRYVMGEIRI
jgi:hypothetical protein